MGKAGFDDDQLIDISAIGCDDLSVAPSAPAAGQVSLYIRSTKLYRKLSSNVERLIGPVDAIDVPFDNTSNGFAATNVQAAIEEISSESSAILFGDGSDGDLTSSSGTTTLTRTMYYNNVTLSGTAVVNCNGFKMYVKGTLAMSGSSSIVRTPNNGTNASGQTNGNGGGVLTANDMGTGLGGQAGVQGASGGIFGSGGNAGNNAGSATGYGAAGGASGAAGSGAAGTAGSYTHVPERIVRHDHLLALAYKNGGQGGAGGAGGAASAFGTGGGGGGGGSGGGVLLIFARVINNTSSVGFRCLGGNGGNGGNASGNATGGGGGGGGGGGQIYLVCNTLTALGNYSVAGGSAGNGGNGSGSVNAP